MTVDLDDALDHWRRAVRVGVVIHRARSAEGQYRPAIGEIEIDDTEPPDSRPPVDHRLGWAVESAWRSIESWRTRTLLSYHYVRNRELREACRKAKIDSRRAAEELHKGRWLMAKRLRHMLDLCKG